MLRSKNLSYLLAFLTTLSLSACHYQFLRGERLFEAQKIMVIPYAENKSIGIAASLSEELSRELAAGGTRLTWQASEAEAILTGRILNEDTNMSQAATNNDHLANTARKIAAYNVNMQIETTLTDLHERVLWRYVTRIDEDFVPPSTSVLGPDIPVEPIAIETKRRVAINRLAQKAAKDIYRQLLIANALNLHAQK